MTIASEDNNVSEDLTASRDSARLKQTLEAALEASLGEANSSKGFLEYAEAFLIFAKYPEKHYQLINAEHDEIWSGPTHATGISDEDLKRLEDLGWNLSDVGGFHRFV